jgi:hypothetical protein
MIIILIRIMTMMVIRMNVADYDDEAGIPLLCGRKH